MTSEREGIVSKDTEHYYKFIGTRADFTDAGRALAPGQIVRLGGEDAHDAEGNARLIDDGLLVAVDPDTLHDQADAIFDAIDRPTKRAAKARAKRDEAIADAADAQAEPTPLSATDTEAAPAANEETV